VANVVAQADLNYGATKSQVLDKAKKFYDLMAKMEFMPNSPTLMNAGRQLG